MLFEELNNKFILLVGLFLFMKCLGFVLLLLLLPFVLAEEKLYQKDYLVLNLDVRGYFTLVPEHEGGRIKLATVTLLLYPHESFRQALSRINNKGKVVDGKIVYEDKDGILGKKEFGYDASIKTYNKRLMVSSKVHFPLTNEEIKGYEAYTLPTEKIDSNNPNVAAKAAELAEGEDDLFKVTFKLASWVEENVKYDLNSLTATVSQSASWVLENREGVCDEMTSLFVAMARSLGIPARFVSGISYTTSDLFKENWQPHGWAEVYFPNIGWVSFDTAFGEYGYVDVTHIQLREGFDPSEPATKYEWLADGVKIESDPLAFKVKVLEMGKDAPEDILLEEELLEKEVGFGSYNLVKGIVKNTASSYTATTLQLATPPEIKIIGRNKRNLLLLPKEVKETYWIIKVPDDLNQGFSYQFPTVIYSERNMTTYDSFSVLPQRGTYSEQDIQKLVVKDEEKSYSRKVSIICNYQKEVKISEDATMSCELKNNGDQMLKEVNFCLDKVCEVVDLIVDGYKKSSIKMKTDKVGWNNVKVSAENGVLEKNQAIQYVVLDSPVVQTKIETPKIIHFEEPFSLLIHLERESFSTPEQVKVNIEGYQFKSDALVGDLDKNEDFQLQLESIPLSKENHFFVTVLWEDKSGKLYSHKEEVIVKGEARTFMESVKMFFNGILSSFY